MIIVRLKPYVRACAAMGLAETNMRAIELHVAGAPDGHPMIRGLRGVRKARVALPGRGKRRGARVVYYLSFPRAALFMLAAYPMSEQDDLTGDQRRAILAALESIKEAQS
jgi:hypothetical protein